MATILIVDDDADIRTFLEVTLMLAGHDVIEAVDGEDGVRRALEDHPDLVLMDVMMPRLDGFGAIERLRADGRTSDLPIIVLTARGHAPDKVSGLTVGADDYITKPFDPDELVARVDATLRRSREMRTVSPLTGLPGNTRIERELRRRIEAGGGLALLYADLNQFKAYNDHYGFMRGDDVLRAFARVVVDVASRHGDRSTFIGHVGGDDFVLITDPAGAEELAGAVCAAFDEVVPGFYDAEDLEAGYIEVTDRRGTVTRFGLVAVSIGIATDRNRTFVHPTEPVAIATEMKSYAKLASDGPSNWALDRRTEG